MHRADRKLRSMHGLCQGLLLRHLGPVSLCLFFEAKRERGWGWGVGAGRGRRAETDIQRHRVDRKFCTMAYFSGLLLRHLSTVSLYLFFDEVRERGGGGGGRDRQTDRQTEI